MVRDPGIELRHARYFYFCVNAFIASEVMKKAYKMAHEKEVTTLTNLASMPFL